MMKLSNRTLASLPLLMAAASCVPAQAGWSEDAAPVTAEAVAAAPGFSFAEAPPASSLRPLDEEQEAQWHKAAGQFDAPSATPAAPFQHLGEATDRMRALDCLANAIYYEARSESEDGQKAVAQVVLNRVRHPAFPSSVCQVVYQGSARRTGCQFSFTCDGSMARRPTGWAWERARRIAEAALQGEVYAPVGNATHYHTRAILPYWAPSLRRAAVVGAHVFYRWRGGQGESRAFRQDYAGREYTPVLRKAVAQSWTDDAAPAEAQALPVEHIRAEGGTVRVHRGDAPAIQESAAENFGVKIHVGPAPAET